MIETTANRAHFVGSGVTTEFPLPFKALAAADVLVWLVDAATGVYVPQTEGVDFSVDGVGDPNGATLVFFTAPAEGERGVAANRPKALQLNDFPEGSRFPSATVEREFDLLTILHQGLADDLTRTLRFPITDPDGISPELPPAEQRAGKLLLFSASGEPTPGEADSVGHTHFYGDATITAAVAWYLAHYADLDALLAAAGQVHLQNTDLGTDAAAFFLRFEDGAGGGAAGDSTLWFHDALPASIGGGLKWDHAKRALFAVKGDHAATPAARTERLLSMPETSANPDNDDRPPRTTIFALPLWRAYLGSPGPGGYIPPWETSAASVHFGKLAVLEAAVTADAWDNVVAMSELPLPSYSPAGGADRHYLRELKFDVGGNFTVSAGSVSWALLEIDDGAGAVATLASGTLTAAGTVTHTVGSPGRAIPARARYALRLAFSADLALGAGTTLYVGGLYATVNPAHGQLVGATA